MIHPTIEYTLTAIDCEDSGELGYKLDGIPTVQGAFMISTDSALIAHDILEHCNGLGKIGSIDDELEALGGVWFIRGENGMIIQGSHSSNADHIENDLITLGRLYVDGRINFRTFIPRYAPNDLHILEDEELNLMLGELYSKLVAECDEDELDYTRKRLNVYMQAIAPYLTQGYNKASERYESWGHANNLFYHIEQELKPYMQPEWAGQQLTLTVDYDTCEITVLEVIDEDDLEEYE